VEWDVAVVGGGPAGLAAAHAAASRGARTLVLERAEHPRYKTCGGGLIGTSLRAVPAGLDVPVRDRIDRATFTLNGRRAFTRSARGALLDMVQRDEFDAALCRAAEAAGATVRARTMVRAIEQNDDAVRIRLTDGDDVQARVVIGADGSAGITGRYVGVRHHQVDLGLEVDVPAPPDQASEWRGRLLIDWGPLPGSYGWVFPKGDLLTVGVIASRGQGEQTRSYLGDFLTRLGLAGIGRCTTRAISPAAEPTTHHCGADGFSSRATRPACSSRGRGRESVSPCARVRSPARRRRPVASTSMCPLWRRSWRR
jgi:geranylgeranyl reductase family protein